MDELLQALDVAVVKELLLEIGSGRLGGGTLFRSHRHIASCRRLHLAVGRRCTRYPCRVRLARGAGAASEEIAQSKISVAEAQGIRGEAERIGFVLIEESQSGVQRQALIGIA